jgi:hypothetical protein
LGPFFMAYLNVNVNVVVSLVAAVGIATSDIHRRQNLGTCLISRVLLYSQGITIAGEDCLFILALNKWKSPLCAVCVMSCGSWYVDHRTFLSPVLGCFKTSITILKFL